MVLILIVVLCPVECLFSPQIHPSAVWGLGEVGRSGGLWTPCVGGMGGTGGVALREKDPDSLFIAASMGGGRRWLLSVRDGPQQTPDLRVLWSWNSRFQNFEKFILISYLVYVWLLFAGLGLNPGSHVQFMLILLLFLGKCSLWYFCYCWLGWIGSVKQQQPLKSYILTNRCGCSQRTWKPSIEEFSLFLSSCV